MNPLSLQRSLDRIAPNYDRHAALEQEVCRRLLERTFHRRHEPAWILDLGCGTGFASAELKKAFRKARVVGLDLSPGMLRGLRSRSRFRRPLHALCGDFHALPFADQSLDFVFSALSLHWSSEPATVFEEVRRVLNPDGLFLFSSLGPESLAELRQACADAGTELDLPDFPDLLELGDALVAAGFREPVMDREQITLQYPAIDALTAELESTGTALMIRGWNERFHTDRAFESACSNLMEQGKYPLSFEIVYGAAFGPSGKFSSTRDHRDTLELSVDSLLKL